MFESFGLAALISVVVLAAAAVFFLRYRSKRDNNPDSLVGGMRIGILESVPVDARRRLVLVRRDDVEHLVMIGGPSEFVVETNIGRTGPGQLADDEPSAAGQRALKEAADRHVAPATLQNDGAEPSFDLSPRPAASLPVDFTFDESELLEGLDVVAGADREPPAVERPARRESAPILSGPQVPPGAANDIRDAGDPIPLPRPMNGASDGPRGAERYDPRPGRQQPSGTELKEDSGEPDAGRIRHMERPQPEAAERSRFSSVRRGSRSDESSIAAEPSGDDRKRGPQATELPAARQLPSVASRSSATGDSSDEIDIENEIVRALRMDSPPDEMEPTQVPALKQSAGGEPRTRLGDLADRLEEALAREVRSASQAKSRLDLDLDSFGFDRERGRAGSNPQRQDRTEPVVRQEEPKPASQAPTAEPERPTPPTSELAEAAAKRDARVRPERQDNPPVISLSARRREVSDPLEDEMARLLGELTGDGSRR